MTLARAYAATTAIAASPRRRRKNPNLRPRVLVESDYGPSIQFPPRSAQAGLIPDATHNARDRRDCRLGTAALPVQRPTRRRRRALIAPAKPFQDPGTRSCDSRLPNPHSRLPSYFACVPGIGSAPRLEVGLTITTVSVEPSGQTIWKVLPGGRVENGMPLRAR